MESAGRIALVLILLGAESGFGARVSAQAEDPNAAEALFDQGRRLMQHQRYAEACPKFSASHKLDPAIGTLLNLAHCWKQLGLTASAWRAYREAASMALWQKQRQREAFARAEASALESALARLRVRVADGNDSELELLRNGTHVPRDIWGEPVPIDPGDYRIEAVAPKRRGFTTLVNVPQAGTVDVDVPVLEPLPEAAAPAQVAVQAPSPAAPSSESAHPPAPPSPVDVRAEPSRVSGNGSSILPALGLGLAGVVGFGVAGFFALRMHSQDDDARSICKDSSAPCSDEDVADHAELKQSAHASRTAAYVSAGVGTACVLGAVVLLLVAPAAQDGPTGAAPRAGVALELAPGTAVVRARGSF